MSFIKVSKSLFLVEEIGNPQILTMEGKSIETRQVQVKALNRRDDHYYFEHFWVLIDNDLANEIMVHENPESLFINGMLVEVRYAGGRRYSILTLRTDDARSQYDIVQCLIGIATSKRFNNISNAVPSEEIDQIREDVANIFNQIQHDLSTPSTIADSINDLFGICLAQMFPVLVIDGRTVRMIHPLIWGFLKQWNLLRQDRQEQKPILINLLRVMERSHESFFRLSLSEEMEFFRNLGIEKRQMLRSIFSLNKIIMAYKKINHFFSQ